MDEHAEIVPLAIHTTSVYTAVMITNTQRYERVNITLPTQTLKRLRHASEERSRSRFIAEAIEFYLKEKGRATVRTLLRAGGKRHAERDRELAEEWFEFDL